MGNTEREGFEPSMGVSTHTAFPDRPSEVQGGAPTGTPYSNSQRLGHHKAGEGTRVGSALGLGSGALGVSSGHAEPTFKGALGQAIPVQVTGRSCAADSRHM
jgi:hypothetical protein